MSSAVAVQSLSFIRNENIQFCMEFQDLSSMRSTGDSLSRYYIRDVIVNGSQSQNEAIERFFTQLISKTRINHTWMTLSVQGELRGWDAVLRFGIEIDRGFLKTLYEILPGVCLSITGKLSLEKYVYGSHEKQGEFFDHFRFCLNCEEHFRMASSSSVILNLKSVPASFLKEMTKFGGVWNLNASIEWPSAEAKKVVDPVPIKLGSNSSFFNRESTKDVTVTFGSGTTIKCHGFILAAHSPVFAKMLSPESGMRESQTQTVLLEENSEKGGTLLIQYLYGMEIFADKLESDTALELLQAAHKYELPQLEKDIGHLILQMGGEWFTPEAALELYFFAKKLEQSEALCDHLLGVMAGMAQKIRSCHLFQEISPTEAADLAWKLLERK